MDLEKLKSEMRDQSITIDELARRANIERSALYRRFNSGGKKLTVAEARSISEALGLDPETVMSIFFEQ